MSTAYQRHDAQCALVAELAEEGRTVEEAARLVAGALAEPSVSASRLAQLARLWIALAD
jgi:hypothetical protein